VSALATIRRLCVPVAIALSSIGGARAIAAQAPPDSGPRYLRPVTPPADYHAAVAAGTRDPSGRPGARYWQQGVRYEIEAELDPATAELRGSERIVYHNRSPVALPTVVLNLYQNVFAPGSPRNRYVNVTGGVTLSRVAVAGQVLAPQTVARIPVLTTPAEGAPVGYSVQGTLARIVLPRPLPSGDSLVLEIDWSHRVPPAPSFRTGWEDALGGRAFQVAQWYPQVAVFDDVDGWDATPYLGDGEFYLEYGDFDVSLTLPAGWLVGASGVLLNGADVLGPRALGRLQSATAGATTHVVTRREIEGGEATQRPAGGKLTWRFRAENVRDFAFAASNRYVWDATRGATGHLVSALYRPGAPHWEEAARHGRHAIDFLGRRLPPLDMDVVIAEGPIAGMEYPGLAFINRPAEEADLYAVIAHEAGSHQWFPMLVGQNEAAYAWMDEGLTTFHEELAVDDFFGTTTAYQGDLAHYLASAGRETEVPLMRHTDLVTPYGARVTAAYTKPGILMRSLRSILGADTFDLALRTYAEEWTRKHPTPWDFFATMERVSGRDLDWFFQPWWYETGVLDQGVESVETTPAGARVTVRDLGQNPMPARVVATTRDGRRLAAEIPVDVWLAGSRTATVTFPAPVTRVEIDPERYFPDVDRSNNVWAR
jgi:hypothetical protein